MKRKSRTANLGPRRAVRISSVGDFEACVAGPSIGPGDAPCPCFDLDADIPVVYDPPMMEKEREAWDKRYGGDFLRFMDVPFSNLQCLSEFSPDCEGMDVAGPDVKVTISDDFGTRRIGIELTLYSSDTSKRKGSVALRRQKVRERLREELKSFLGLYPELDRFQIRVRFRRGEENLRANDCRRIAQEVAELLGPKLPGVQGDRSFDAYPHLAEWIYSIGVYRNPGNYRGTSGWFNGTGPDWPGIEPEQVCHLINKHDPSKYDLRDVNNECWLVIYSTGVGGSAVRAREMEQQSLSSPDIAEAVARSGFDRVYFWSQDFEWAAPLGSAGDSPGGAPSQVG